MDDRSVELWLYLAKTTKQLCGAAIAHVGSLPAVE